MAPTVASLLDRVVPALEQYRGLGDVLRWIEAQLRRTVPPVSLRLVEPNAPAPGGVKSVLIQVPGSRMSSMLVSVDLPRGFVLNDWQSRVLRVASRLIALLQRLERGTAESPLRIARDSRDASAADQKPASQPRGRTADAGGRRSSFAMPKVSFSRDMRRTSTRLVRSFPSGRRSRRKPMNASSSRSHA